MHIDDNQLIKVLEELDKQRIRAKTAADALREANRWSTLVNSRQALMDGEDNVEQARLFFGFYTSAGRGSNPQLQGLDLGEIEFVSSFRNLFCLFSCINSFRTWNRAS